MLLAAVRAARELDRYGVRVNAVAPTFVRTELTTVIFSSPDMLKTVMSHTPLGRLPEADDIAAIQRSVTTPIATGERLVGVGYVVPATEVADLRSSLDERGLTQYLSSQLGEVETTLHDASAALDSVVDGGAFL